jgi:hypothetical protein
MFVFWSLPYETLWVPRGLAVFETWAGESSRRNGCLLRMPFVV